MISSFIQGGLGNQLFQIAAGYSHSLEVSSSFALSLGQHHLPLQGSNISVYRDTIFKKIKFQNLDLSKLLLYKEPKFSFSEIPKLDNLLLFGYFQSEKYFKKYKDKIYDLFSFPRKKEAPNIKVSLHIRRGDYARIPKILPILPLSYYKDAIDVIGEYDEILIFSDDESLALEKEFKNSRRVNAGNDLDDFILMSSCQHNIIANSSFSWWSAYLNPNQSKKVVAPKTWFGQEGPQDWQDIYCDGWRVI